MTPETKRARPDWYVRGEYVVTEDTHTNRTVAELYQRGKNLIPRLLLGMNAPYGSHYGGHRLHIPKDRYIEIQSRLREGIRSDLRLKADLYRTTWHTLQQFRTTTCRFERAIRHGCVSSDLLDESFRTCASALTLTEFNGMLPLTWYREQLARYNAERWDISLEHFFYSDVTPYRILFRRGALRILHRVLRETRRLTHRDIATFVACYGYLDPRPPGPLLRRPSERTARATAELSTMARDTTVDAIEAELRELSRRRDETRARYHAGLSYLARRMSADGTDDVMAHNVLSAFAIASLASSEEEYRHIWLARFWRAVGAVLRGLDLPASASTRDILRAARLRPTWQPDSLTEVPDEDVVQHHGGAV